MSTAKFKYLGSLFSPDGRQICLRYGGDGNEEMWSTDTPLWLIKPGTNNQNQALHRSSLFLAYTYRCESWTFLTNKVPECWMEQTAKCSRGSRVRASGTKRDPTWRTTSYNLTLVIRKRRSRWSGDIRRRYWGTDNILMHAVCIQDQTNKQGNLLMDAPGHESMEQLSQMAQDKAFWNEHSEYIYWMRKSNQFIIKL